MLEPSQRTQFEALRIVKAAIAASAITCFFYMAVLLPSWKAIVWHEPTLVLDITAANFIMVLLIMSLSTTLIILIILIPILLLLRKFFLITKSLCSLVAMLVAIPVLIVWGLGSEPTGLEVIGMWLSYAYLISYLFWRIGIKPRPATI